MDSSNELPVDRHQTRADHVVTMARRHADEIRAAAEQEAERVLGEAEQQAIGVRREAEQHAERVRLEAEQVAARRNQEQLEAEQQAERVRVEAEQELARLHREQLEAEQQAQRVRREADQHADGVRYVAEQQAERLRREAEQHAERIRLEAEQEAARLRQERLEAERRERIRLGVQRSQLEGCLDTTSSNLAQIRELIAVLPDINSEDPVELRALQVPIAAVTAGTMNAKPGISHRLLNSVAIILGTWSVVMVLTLLVLNSATNDRPTGQHEPPPVTAATPARAEAQPAVPPQADAEPVAQAITPAPPRAPEVAKISNSQEIGLTVAFVASQDCWLSIASDDGTPSERMLRASEKYVVHARDVVTFKAGNAAALSVLINDQPAGPLGSEGRTVTRRITRANYKSFLQS